MMHFAEISLNLYIGQVEESNKNNLICEFLNNLKICSQRINRNFRNRSQSTVLSIFKADVCDTDTKFRDPFCLNSETLRNILLLCIC